MSIQAVAWVIEHSKARLASRLVLISIANHADAQGVNSWPSVGTIAKESGVSEREVQRSIQRLEKDGELIIHRSAGPSRCHKFILPLVTKLSDMGGDKSSPLPEQGGRQIVAGGVTNGRDWGDRMSPKPSLNHPEPSKKAPPTPQGVVGDLFEKFWADYPKKKSKGQAERAFEALKPTTELFAKMLSALECQAKSQQWQEEGGKYIPHPATWLRAKAWEDQLPTLISREGNFNNENHRTYSNGHGRLPAGADRYAADCQHVVESGRGLIGG